MEQEKLRKPKTPKKIKIQVYLREATYNLLIDYMEMKGLENISFTIDEELEKRFNYMKDAKKKAEEKEKKEAQEAQKAQETKKTEQQTKKKYYNKGLDNAPPSEEVFNNMWKKTLEEEAKKNG